MTTSPKSSPSLLGAVITHSEAAGVAEQSDWASWIGRGRAPESGSGNNFATNYTDDLTLLRDHGISEVTLTLEWAALEPRQGRRDNAQVEYLATVLMAARELGLACWACLVDGTLPGWFAVDQRGFIDEHSRSLLWPRHVEWVGETFGQWVNGWVPMREATQHAVRGNLLAMSPPGLTDPTKTDDAVAACIAATDEAARVLRGSGPVAIFDTTRTFVAEAKSDTAADRVAALEHARMLTTWYSSRWKTDRRQTTESSDSTIDRHVLQVRPPVAVDAEGNWAPCDPGFLTEGMAAAVEHVTKTENDAELVLAADLAPIDDDGAAQADYLGELFEMADDFGADGWWQTSPIDGWHWERGFDERGGLFNQSREPRAAAEVFAARSSHTS